MNHEFLGKLVQKRWFWEDAMKHQPGATKRAASEMAYSVVGSGKSKKIYLVYLFNIPKVDENGDY